MLSNPVQILGYMNLQTGHLQTHAVKEPQAIRTY